MYPMFSKYSGRTIHIVGVALFSIWTTSKLINYVWPINEKDNSSKYLKTSCYIKDSSLKII